MKDILAKTEKAEKEPPLPVLPIKWRSVEYEDRPKTNDWYWYLASATLLLLIVAFLMKNFLLGAFVLIAAFTVGLLASKKPKEFEFSIEAGGIKIDKKIYPYEELKYFWINYDPPRKKELIIESGKILTPHIKIPLADTDPNVVREALLNFVEEKKIEESLIENLADWLGF
jgi:hypothetical protein